MTNLKMPLMTKEGKSFRILLSNDDGIHGPGLRVLEEIALTLSNDVWIVAPSNEQSGAAHSLSIGRPLRVRQLKPQEFIVEGTPTDSVLIGVNKILADHKPDLILSGINHGANLGEDVTYSGTVAAALEGTLLGIPSIALSQVLKKNKDDYSVARRWAPKIIEKLVRKSWPSNVLININFPAVSADDITDIRVVSQGLRNIKDNLDEAQDPQGKSFFWIGNSRDHSPTENSTDLEAIYQGAISITPLHLDLTHYPTIENLKKIFNNYHE